MNTLKELNVLYVEDEHFVAQSMTRLLSLQFKEVTHKENGKVALEEFLSNQDKYNLIITDLRMPVMHGIDMIKEIKKVDSLIPIYVISGDAELEKLLDSLDVKNHFSKPIDLRNVFEVLKEDFS